MLKGIIVEQSAKHWVVMTRDGRFLKVGRGVISGEVGKEVTIPLQRKRVFARISASVAAVFLFLMVLGAWQGWFFDMGHDVVAYVAIDINPSVELGINRSDKVIEARGLNEDGMELINKVHLEGKKIDEAIRLLISRADEEQYLGKYVEQGAGSIFVTGTFVQEEDVDEFRIMQQIEQNIEQTLVELHPEDAHFNIVAVTAPQELREEALHTGVSSGKVALKLLSEAQGHTISWEELKEMSVHEIVQRTGGMDELLPNDLSQSKERLRQLLDRQTVNRIEEEVIEPEEPSGDPARQSGLRNPHHRQFHCDDVNSVQASWTCGSESKRRNGGERRLMANPHLMVSQIEERRQGQRKAEHRRRNEHNDHRLKDYGDYGRLLADRSLPAHAFQERVRNGQASSSVKADRDILQAAQHGRASGVRGENRDPNVMRNKESETVEQAVMRNTADPVRRIADPVPNRLPERGKIRRDPENKRQPFSQRQSSYQKDNVTSKASSDHRPDTKQEIRNVRNQIHNPLEKGIDHGNDRIQRNDRWVHQEKREATPNERDSMKEQDKTEQEKNKRDRRFRQDQNKREEQKQTRAKPDNRDRLKDRLSESINKQVQSHNKSYNKRQIHKQMNDKVKEERDKRR